MQHVNNFMDYVDTIPDTWPLVIILTVFVVRILYSSINSDY